MKLFELHRWVGGSQVSYTHWGSGEPNSEWGGTVHPDEQTSRYNQYMRTDLVIIPGRLDGY